MTGRDAGIVHAWMPIGSCGAACDRTPSDHVSVPTAILRAAAAVLLAVSFPLVHGLGATGLRPRVQRWYSRILLRCFGIRLRVVDRRPVGVVATIATDSDAGMLIVSGHVSWLDIPALIAAGPLSPFTFVARADLVSWPVVGRWARRAGVILIDRERLRCLPGVVAEVGSRLAHGQRVSIFPEGTTWCGHHYGRLRPALFQAAVDTGTWVQPVRLRYLDHHGRLTTRPRFVGAETLVGSVGRMLRARAVTVEVTVETPQPPGYDRRELAARCERALRGSRRRRPSPRPLWEASRV